MIEMFSLQAIPFQPDPLALLKQLRIANRPEYAQRCTRLLEEATPLARPKAIYGRAAVRLSGDDTVEVEGVTLTSRVLRVNVGESRSVFPFLITCGTELEAWARPITDMLERFWADAIMEEALRAALSTLQSHLAERYKLDHTGMMNPGSLGDWPLEQQRGLFAILGDTQRQLGVTLTDSCIMLPIKSASGLIFETQDAYENCQMCPREKCSNRRAPYDAGLYGHRYASGCSGRLGERSDQMHA